ncbi:hypothetical protein L211DRAFT_839459 [Terfezia boudieri ATCC MYA-4762]|uniref:Uncharacterized protein n=1 Tax=Terfezia boudieri ATCC MYA-4762 TaxID=1051890 RepID=A0A3N4LIL1_9PEZI|nr:hypothetical protein L211DRAFT_839459 [Terfezia boudieri ATCC MYA-4762]
MTVAEWFGKQDLGLKYAIVLGSLIITTVVFAACKLIHTKQRLKKFQKEAETAQVEGVEEQHDLNGKVEDEGDLFGLRALEKGFFGGVAQSRPASISSSTLVLPRSAHIFGRSSSELVSQRSIDRTPAAGCVVSRPGLHGSAEMQFVSPQMPTAYHQHNRSRSPSPTTFTNSQTSIGNSVIKLYSSSPLSARNQEPAGMTENSSIDSFIPNPRMPGGNCHDEVQQVHAHGRGTHGFNSA